VERIVLGEDVIYVKCVLRGEPARIIRELKGRGVACSIREIVVQGLLALEEKTIEHEIRVERSKSLRRGEES
jgi:hypothetical protein